MKIFKYIQLVFLLFINFICEAQIKNKVTKYADLHAHTVIKHYYNSENTLEELMTDDSSQAYKLNELQYKNGKIKFSNKKTKLSSANFIQYYQTNNAEYEKLKGSILIESLTPLEYSTFNNSLKALLGNLFSGINGSKLKIIGKGYHTYKPQLNYKQDFIYSQFQDLKGQNNFFVNANKDTSKYHVIKWNDNVNEIIKQNPDKILLATSIEGGHCFQDSLTAKKLDNYYKKNILNYPYLKEYRKNLYDTTSINEAKLTPIYGIIKFNQYLKQIKSYEKLKNTYDSLIKNDKFIQTELRDLKNRVEIAKNFKNRIYFVSIGHHSFNGMLSQAAALDQSNRLTKNALRLAYKNKWLQEQIFYKGINSFFPLYLPKLPFKVENESSNEITYNGTSGMNIFGDSLVEFLLNNSENKRILIDIKHMSFASRIAYYNLLNEKFKIENRKIPIVASHCAAAKKTYEYFKTCKCNDLNIKECDKYSTTIDEKNNTFYPWSINLFDEEIKYIYDSEGIIGIPLEERMIGAYQYDYFENRKKTIKKYEKIFRNNRFINKIILPDFVEFRKKCNLPYFSEKEFKEISSSTDEMAKLYIELEPFLNNVFYIASKSGEIPKNAFDRICIGSDYDGNIDPIDICPTARYMPDFENYLKLFIKIYPLIHDEYKDLFSFYENNSDELVEKIMYSNLKNFLYEQTQK